MLRLRSPAIAARALVATGLVGAASCFAGTGDALFEVHVILRNPGTQVVGGASGAQGSNQNGAAACTGLSEGDMSRGLVQVACNAGQFVEIAPAPDVQTEASQKYRVPLEGGFPVAPQLAVLGASGDGSPEGIVTALQVSNATGNGSVLEMLVSF